MEEHHQYLQYRNFDRPSHYLMSKQDKHGVSHSEAPTPDSSWDEFKDFDGEDEPADEDPAWESIEDVFSLDEEKNSSIKSLILLRTQVAGASARFALM